MCCERLAGNTGCKNDAKKLPSEHHCTTLSGMSSQLRHVLTIGKKLVKQQYILQMSLQYGELRPTNGWDRLAGLGHPIIFQRVSRLGSVTAQQSSSGRQLNFAALNRGRHLCLLCILHSNICFLIVSVIHFNLPAVRNTKCFTKLTQISIHS